MQKARCHPTKRAPTVCRRLVSGSISPRCLRYFSPFPHGTGSLSVSDVYLALADGAASFRGGSSGPPLLRIPTPPIASTRTGLSPSVDALPNAFRFVNGFDGRSYNPAAAVTAVVWAMPLSLATTQGITLVFSSCGYLDVSVPHVRLTLR